MTREPTDIKDILSIYDMEYGVTPALTVLHTMFCEVLRDWTEVMLVKGEHDTWVCRASNPTTGDGALVLSANSPEEAIYKVVWHAWNIDVERRNSTEGESGPAAPAPR